MGTGVWGERRRERKTKLTSVRSRGEVSLGKGGERLTLFRVQTVKTIKKLSRGKKKGKKRSIGKFGGFSKSYYQENVNGGEWG